MKRLLLFSFFALLSILVFDGCVIESPEKVGEDAEENEGILEAMGPQIETLSAVKGTLFVVLLEGRVSGLEGIALDFECGVEYSTDAFFNETNTIRQKSDRKYTETPYTIAVTNVFQGQKYYYRAYYVSQSMIYYGEVEEFSFTWDAPQVSTIDAAFSGEETYICKGLIIGLSNIVDYYTDPSLYCGIQYSTSVNFDVNTTQTCYTGEYNKQMGDTIVCPISYLKYNTVYYYRVFFNLGPITTYGDIKSFILKPKENGYENGYQYIELGLSVKWATCNVGASQPWSGWDNYYSWGETKIKADYSWRAYKFRTSGDSWNNVKLNKYNTISDYGTVDNKITLDLEDDIAHVKLGGSWRTPTITEMEELYDNCTWEWYSSDNREFGGIAGYKVTSNKDGYTDRYIFLPAVGYNGTSKRDFVGYRGLYWTNTLDTDSPYFAWCLYIKSEEYKILPNDRNVGISVRPVCP